MPKFIDLQQDEPKTFLIVGKRSCGKSVLVLNILLNLIKFKNISNIKIITSGSNINFYSKFVSPVSNILPKFDSSIFKQILMNQNKSTEPLLLILDDSCYNNNNNLNLLNNII